MKSMMKKATISNAILWAAALISSSLFLRGSNGNEGLVMMLLVLATMSCLQFQDLSRKVNAGSEKND